MSQTSFCFGQPQLQNKLVVLEPFKPDSHAAHFVSTAKKYPNLLQFISLSAFDTEADFVDNFYNKSFRDSAKECLYAITDRAHDEYAGIVNLSVPEPAHASANLGIIVFPEFQRTHVASNAIGLALLWALDPPSKGGLGLRRVEWSCHSENTASMKTAQRMGFTLEGILRWHQAVPEDRPGHLAEALGRRNCRSDEQPGRHTAMLSIVWDEWEEKRPKVVEQME